VAVPHARLTGLDRVRAVFVRLETPVAFGAVDDKPVDLLVALFAPKDADSSHLRALARISRMMRQPDLRESCARPARPTPCT
jgi:PTS system nitrogen regulatory IIA component